MILVKMPKPDKFEFADFVVVWLVVLVELKSSLTIRLVLEVENTKSDNCIGSAHAFPTPTITTIANAMQRVIKFFCEEIILCKIFVFIII